MDSEKKRNPGFFVALAGLILLGLPLSCADFSRGEPGPNGGDAGLENGAGPNGQSALSFATDIHPLVLRDCLACHGNGGEAENSGLVFVQDPDADYATTLRFVDESEPEKSRLLIKATGQGHSPGATWSKSGPEYERVLRWINEGALP
jgi:hypothetical protein